MKDQSNQATEPMYDWACDLFPYCRSLTGSGTAETLRYLQGLVPGLSICSVPSGTEVLDWIVPLEWNIRDAYITDLQGHRIIDFKQSNLHVVGYSEPIDRVVDWEELRPRLHSLPEQPDAIPYVTSYYKRTWGFCLTDRQLLGLTPGSYRVVVDSTLAPGALQYGELRLPGETEQEVLLSTYICHPSMANNELSGPVVTAALARWLMNLTNRRLSYRILFLPETIGAITYLSSHVKEMRARTIAGFIMTCIGDERAWSFLPSRHGGTLADRVALHVLDTKRIAYTRYSFLDRGSDERQYCAPGVDLPVVSIMRSKYGTYPEYHTSLDDLSLITQHGLAASLGVLRDCLKVLEVNRRYRTTTVGEPQLGRRGLYPSLSTKATHEKVRLMMDTLAYADGTVDLITMSELIGSPALDVAAIAEGLVTAGVMERVAEEQTEY